MSMDHLNEKELEKLASDYIVGKTNDVFLLNGHLTLCELCKSKFDFFVEFYKNFNSIIDIDYPIVDNLVKRISGPNIIKLHKFIPNIELEDISKENTLLLAADTGEIDNEVFSPIATFSSEEKKIVARIIRRNTDNSIIVSILTEDMQSSEHLLVAFTDEKGLKKFFATDENGKIVIPGKDLTDWQISELLIYCCKAEYDFTITDSAERNLLINSFNLTKSSNILIVFSDNSLLVINNKSIPESFEKSILKVRVFD